jgi:hypothetical protein
MAEQRYDLLKDPGMIKDLQTLESARKLYTQLQEITRKVNQLVQVPYPPAAFGFTVDFTGTRASLWWNDVPDKMRQWVDGVRIWRVNAAEDADEDLNKNEKATILVSCTRTTGYTDMEVTVGQKYIYWIQWISIDGVMGPVAGGISGTIGTSGTVSGGPAGSGARGGRTDELWGTARGTRGGMRRLE